MSSRPGLRLAFLFSLLAASSVLHGALANGPMLAHLDLREARIWVQTESQAEIRVAYRPALATESWYWTVPVATAPHLGHTAVAVLDQIEPGTDYHYRVEVNGDWASAELAFRSPENYHTRRPPPDFTIAAGGAHYALDNAFDPPYTIPGGGYDIFSTIQEADPELMIWLGDTAHLRPADRGSHSGYLRRFTTARSVPQLQPLLQQIPHYAVWGSHDFGGPLGGQLSSYRTRAEASFEAFWPRPLEVDQLEGIATQIRYADVDFFLLDVRSYREDRPDSSSAPRILGREQIAWLRHQLIRSEATFKVIVGGAPLLNPADSPENLSFAESEQTEFLQMMREERIAGLFFLSGGKGYGELTRLVHANSYNLHDLTLGPMTAAPASSADELNFFRVPGSSVFERHFALLDFSGPEDDRRLTLRVMSIEGNELFRREIRAQNLQHGDGP